MNLKTTYKILVLIGILLFISGVIGDGNSIPYLRHGAVLGPIFFTIGTVIWLPLRIRKPILHPFNSNEYKSLGDAFFAFVFNNFVLEFWAFCCAFGMLLVIGGGSSMKSSEGFQSAVIKIQEDKQLTELIGEFRGTGALLGGSTSSIEAKLDFSVYGTTGGIRVNIELEKNYGEWQVLKLIYN